MKNFQLRIVIVRKIEPLASLYYKNALKYDFFQRNIHLYQSKTIQLYMFFTVSNFLHFLYHMTISDDGRMCRGLKRFIIRDERTGSSKRIDSHKARLFYEISGVTNQYGQQRHKR